MSAPRAELRARIRPLLGMGDEADKLADRIVAAFSVVELSAATIHGCRTPGGRRP